MSRPRRLRPAWLLAPWEGLPSGNPRISAETDWRDKARRPAPERFYTKKNDLQYFFINTTHIFPKTTPPVIAGGFPPNETDPLLGLEADGLSRKTGILLNSRN
jgi:hypothetical protein